MDPESSFELIRLAREGNQVALERLLDRYRPRLVRWSTGRLPRYARDATDTEDLVQDVLVRTVRNLEDFRDQGEWALQAYLRAAVNNRIRDELRKFEARPRRLEISDDLRSHEASPIEVAIGRETFERYERALAAMEPKEREAVIARLEIGSSYADISVLIGKPSADAARMTVTRALVKLADMMTTMKS